MAMRTTEYSAYSGSALGLCEMCEVGPTGPSNAPQIPYTPQMAAKTKRKTAISIRKAQAHREPAGRAAVGGSGVLCCVVASGAVGGTRRSGLGERQLAGGGVIIEKLGVAPPLDGGLQLALRLVFAEVLVDEIVEKFGGQRAIGFCFERLLHLAEYRDVGERRFAEHRFARLDVSLCEGVALRRDDGVSFFEADEAEQDRGVHRRKQRVNFETQFVGKMMEIDAAALVAKNLEQAGHASRARVWQHQGVMLDRSAGAWRHVNHIIFRVGAGEDAVDGIDELDEARRLAVSRLRQVHDKIRVNVRGIAAEDDDAVGEDHGFFNVVGDDEDGARRNLVPDPKLEQFAAQRFGGEHVEGGEGLVHEQAI